jgi:membrane fusion protein
LRRSHDSQRLSNRSGRDDELALLRRLSMSDLFRKEVLEKRTSLIHGHVMLVQPITHTFFAMLACAILLGLVLILFLVDYTRTVEVPGVLEPVGGIIKMLAPSPGRVTAIKVYPGQQVRKGDILIILATESRNADGSSVETEEEIQIRRRLATLNDEKRLTSKLQLVDKETSKQQLKGLQTALVNLEQQRVLQNERLQFLENTVKNYTRLKVEGFLSEAQLLSKQDELIEQRLRMQTLEMQIASTQLDRDKAIRDIDAYSDRGHVVSAQFDRNLALVTSELDQHQGHNQWALVASTDAVVASIVVQQDQLVNAGLPILSLVPTNRDLVASLYAPSRSLGFIRRGQAVSIKLDAYPYQRYGTLSGTVESIAAIPATPEEVTAALTLLPTGLKSEPAYKIQVVLAQQSLRANGEERLLKVGLQGSAMVALDTRALYQWVVEPLYQ